MVTNTTIPGGAAAWKEVEVGEVVMKVPETFEYKSQVRGALGGDNIGEFKVSPQGSSGSRSVWVQKHSDIFEGDLDQGKALLHEVRVLKELTSIAGPGLAHILETLMLFTPDPSSFRDWYMVVESMGTSLADVVRSRNVLIESHYQYFIGSVLRGLIFLHSAGVVHRNLDSSNVLINMNDDVKIRDFRCARPVGKVTKEMDSLPDSVHLWCQAPEEILFLEQHQTSADIWSVGCILAAFIKRRPFVHAQDEDNQIKGIIEVLGVSDQDDLSWVPAHSLDLVTGSLGPGQDEEVSVSERWRKIFGKAELHEDLAEVLESTLSFHPRQRKSAKHVWDLRFFEDMHYYDENCDASRPLDWNRFRAVPDRESLRQQLLCEASEADWPFQ